MTRDHRHDPKRRRATSDPAKHATPGKRTLVEQAGGSTRAHRPLDLSLPPEFGAESAAPAELDANARLQAILEEPGAPTVDDREHLARLLKSLPPYLQEAARRKGLPVPGLPGAIRPAMVDAGTDETGTSHSAPGLEYTVDFDF